jgi:hypothetical protein
LAVAELAVAELAVAELVVTVVFALVAIFPVFLLLLVVAVLGLAVALVVFEGPVFVIDQVIVVAYSLYLGAALNILASVVDLTGQVLASVLVVVKADPLSVRFEHLAVLAIFEYCLQF